jgi:hypothetical protein
VALGEEAEHRQTQRFRRGVHDEAEVPDDTIDEVGGRGGVGGLNRRVVAAKPGLRLLAHRRSSSASTSSRIAAAITLFGAFAT